MKTSTRGITSRLRPMNIHLVKYLLNVSEKKQNQKKNGERIRCRNISETTTTTSQEIK